VKTSCHTNENINEIPCRFVICIVPDLLKCSSFVAFFFFWLCSYMIGCQGYPRCRASVFFPKFVVEAAVHESVCQRCQPGDVHKISFKFKRGSVPPMMPLEWVLGFALFKSKWTICVVHLCSLYAWVACKVMQNILSLSHFLNVQCTIKI